MRESGGDFHWVGRFEGKGRRKLATDAHGWTRIEGDQARGLFCKGCLRGQKVAVGGEELIEIGGGVFVGLGAEVGGDFGESGARGSVGGGFALLGKGEVGGIGGGSGSGGDVGGRTGLEGIVKFGLSEVEVVGSERVGADEPVGIGKGFRGLVKFKGEAQVEAGTILAKRNLVRGRDDTGFLPARPSERTDVVGESLGDRAEFFHGFRRGMRRNRMREAMEYPSAAEEDNRRKIVRFPVKIENQGLVLGGDFKGRLLAV
jgi:hypothetical protein